MAKRSDKVYTENFDVPELEWLNFNQERYANAIKRDEIVLGIGSAGTGKTFIAASIAADLYRNKQIRNIIVTRPTVPCGDEMGHLPGNLDEKFDPWIRQVINPIKRRLSAGKFDCDFGKRILAIPLQFMRGETFDNAVVIVDEAQNLSIEAAIMASTRIGVGSKIIFCGDLNQSDLECPENGLGYLVRTFRKHAPDIEIIEFTNDDCVRSDLVKRLLGVFEKEGY